MDKNFYNSSSSSKLGWKPQDFGCDDFDDDLVKAIKIFQKSVSIKADGLCGPGTYRRLIAKKESEAETHRRYHAAESDNNHIICNGVQVPILWNKVLTYEDLGGFKLSTGYRSCNSLRDVKMFVNHWDVCLSAETCVKVLKKRGISVQFCIDNDGTIYQLMDANHIAYHAGSSKWNSASIGVEISNAYYPKYQNWYKKNGYGERPVWKDKKVHGGKLGDFLGFYDVQLEAAKALWKSIGSFYKIPLEGPKVSDSVDPDSVKCKFRGIINHYNLTKRKIDCAGLDIDNLLKDLK
jgi:N-acetyl-anhydromuramyl-L-alanine amidase AmpD